MIKIDVLLSTNTKYADIFPIKDKDNVNKLYKEYCKAFHPDVCQHVNATDAFTNLQALYKEAVDALEGNTWIGSNSVFFQTTTKGLSINYLYHHVFELGEYYVTNDFVVYVFEKSKKLYYNNYIKRVKNIKYADDKMKSYYERFMPSIYKEYDTDTKHIIVINKPRDVYPLRCLIENYFDNAVPSEHLAWITTRLVNLCCFFNYNKIVMNGINVDNLFVSPQHHSICMYGGWWYAVPEGEKMVGTTGDIFNVMTPKTKANKIAEAVTDVESIKLIGRRLSDAKTPAPLSNFYSLGSTNNAIEAAEDWEKAIENAFGRRKFIKIENINNKTIYKKG